MVGRGSWRNENPMICRTRSEVLRYNSIRQKILFWSRLVKRDNSLVLLLLPGRPLFALLDSQTILLTQYFNPLSYTLRMSSIQMSLRSQIDPHGPKFMPSTPPMCIPKCYPVQPLTHWEFTSPNK